MSHLVADSQIEYPADYPYAPRAPRLPPWKEPPETKGLPQTERRFSILAAALAFAFLWADFSIFPLFKVVGPNYWGALWVYVLCGVIMAQAALLSVFLVFTEGSFWRRFIGCWSAAIISWGLWIAGIAAAMLFRFGRTTFFLEEFTEFIQFFGVALPFAALAVQAPLWFCRLYLGWRLRTSTTVQAPAQPLSIRDYMVGTGIVAISVTLARLTPDAHHSDYWSEWAVFDAVASALSALGVVPAMLLLFRVRPWQFGYGLYILYGPVIGALVIGITMLFWGPPPRAWEAFGIVMSFVSFAVFLGLGLKAMQNLGFQLVLTRSKQP